MTIIIDNLIGDEGEKAIVTMLEKNYSITDIYLHPSCQEKVQKICERNKVWLEGKFKDIVKHFYSFNGRLYMKTF